MKLIGEVVRYTRANHTIIGSVVFRFWDTGAITRKDQSDHWSTGDCAVQAPDLDKWVFDYGWGNVPEWVNKPAHFITPDSEPRP